MPGLDRGPIQDFLPQFRAGPATYVLLGSIRGGEPLALAPSLQAYCSAFALVGRYPPRALLLRLRRPDEAGDQEACRALEWYRRASYGRDFDYWPYL